MARILIIGGHGKIALLAAPLLISAGHEVSSVVRNRGHFDDVRRTGAEPLLLDVESATADDLAAAIEGYDVVVWSAGAGGGSTERTYAVDRDAAVRTIDAAGRSGARFVMVSYFGAGPDHGVPPDNSFFAYAEAKSAADQHLTESELGWTILRPSSLTLAEPTGRVDAGADQGSQVSRGNVARVIVAAVAAQEAAARRVVEFNDGDTPIGELFTADPTR